MIHSDGERKAPIDYVPAEINDQELFAEENTIHTGEHFSQLMDDTDERLRASVVSDIEGIERQVIRLATTLRKETYLSIVLLQNQS